MTQKEIKEYILENYKAGLSTVVMERELKKMGAKTERGATITTGHISLVANRAGLRRMNKKRFGQHAKQSKYKLKTETVTQVQQNHHTTSNEIDLSFYEEVLSSNLSDQIKIKILRGIAK